MKKYTLRRKAKEAQYDTEKEVWKAIGEDWSPYLVVYTETGGIVEEFITF